MSAARRAMWATGLPARTVLISAIKLYRVTLSGLLGGQCRFHPTCSVYAEEAIRSKGATVGSALATWRVLRCNPFGRGGIEPAPLRRPLRGDGGADAGPEYDGVSRSDRERTVV
jgi:putative membrane protein insertion efficiency factor